MSRIGILGAGIMGVGIAEVAAKAGYEVVLRSRSATSADARLTTFKREMLRQEAKGRLKEGEADAAIARVQLSSDLGDLHGCQLVIEAVIEDLATKVALFAEVERVVGPEVVLATNTSSLPVLDLALAVSHPERVCGMHFFNPAPLMKLVEIVVPITASEETIAIATDVSRTCGKRPVRVKDSAGFVVNALLFPYLNNAVRLLERGVAERDAIDDAMKGGCGFPIGPFALLDLVGLDTSLAILERLHAEHAEPNYAPNPLLRRLVAAGYLGRKSGRGFHTY